MSVLCRSQLLHVSFQDSSQRFDLGLEGLLYDRAEEGVVVAVVELEAVARDSQRQTGDRQPPRQGPERQMMEMRTTRAVRRKHCRGRAW